MIIGACGYGGTGSSAVKDFIKEFDNVQTLDRSECQYAFKVDGLQDLEYHVIKQYSRQMSGDIAIERFLDAARYAHTPIVKKIYKNKKKYLSDTEEFIQSIIQAYLGLDNADFETGNIIRNIVVLCFKKFIIPQYEKKTGKLYKYWPMRKMHVCIKPEQFYIEAKKYMTNVLKNGGADFSKIIVLDQPFEGNKPMQSFPFFENPVAIVVDRDPRDLYMAASYQWPDGTFMPRRDPEAFVQYFRQQRVDVLENSEDKNRVLRIKLEDMIFNYKDTTKKIMQFLGLEESTHIYRKKYFNPDYSIKGTQIYKKIKGHESEIEYIEKNLKEYLFPFEEYDAAKKNDVLVWIP